jgi:sugar O-acyltransferase (sialic acid O-acetyltransferase NeuD family)
MRLQLNLLMENKVILYGASGHCKVIVDIFINNNITIDYILDDNDKTITILNKPVLHSSKYNLQQSDEVILSIGNNKVRKKLSQILNVTFINAIHPKSIISSFSTIDEGTVVMAGAIINPDVKIGKHCIINTGAIIEHDCVINNFAHISPNASLAGNVTIGEGSQVGIGANIIQGISIGKWVIIGAGAVIINDIPDHAVVVGNPGKTIKYNK